MAAGTLHFNDFNELKAGNAPNPSVNISEFLSQINLLVTYQTSRRVSVFGRLGELNAVGAHYRGELTLGVEMDGYGPATIDTILRTAFRPPLGPSSGTGLLYCAARPTINTQSATGTADNPLFTFAVSLSNYQPFAQGQAAQAAMQTRTFPVHGNIDVTPAVA